MDLSLDEIIKKKNIKMKSNKQYPNKLHPRQTTSNKKNDSIGIANRLANRNRNTSKASRGSFLNKDKNNIKAPRLGQNFGVVDARIKIIKNSRQRLVDARDKLAYLAKQTDARTRIRPWNQNVMLKQDHRQNRNQRSKPNIGRVLHKPVILQRSIRNSIPNMRVSDATSLRRCAFNHTNTLFDEDIELVDRESPQRMRQNNFSQIKMVARNEYHHQQEQVYMPREPEPYYPEERYEPPVFRQYLSQREEMMSKNGGRMSQQMRARLDTSPMPYPQYHPPPRARSPPPFQGHRIVVSNLHPSVTHEDIKELFEDIGPLMTSRLVRPGTAEVLYKFQKDAKTAVDAYHNRQLDGQPMKCLLVNSKPSPGSSGVLRSNNMQGPPKFPMSSKSMVVPELSTIHKALFNQKMIYK